MSTKDLAEMRQAWRAFRRRWRLNGREAVILLQTADKEGAEPDVIAVERMRILIEIGHRLVFLPGDDLSIRLRTATAAFSWLSPLEAMSEDATGLARVREMVGKGVWA